MQESITIIISSGLVSAAVAFGSMNILFGQYKQKIDQNEKTLEKLCDKVDALSDRISRLEGGVDRDREFFKAQSPVSLTEKGKAVLLDSNGKDYIDRNLKELLNLIQTQHPKSAYDVQEMCKDVIKSQIDKDEFIPFKDFVFKKGLSLETLINILAIYLRDIVLEKLGFNLKDIP